MGKKKVKKISDESTSLDEITIHNESLKDYNCELCEKVFDIEWRLKRHIYFVHDGIKEYNNRLGQCFLISSDFPYFIF